MKTRIFISRKLDDQSVFKSTLNNLDIDITDQYLIQFTDHKFDPPNTEWLFFYSKSGLKYFTQSILDLSNYKIATFGPSTAALYESYANKPADFIGVGIKEQVAEKFKSVKNMESCTFAVGVNSLRSVQDIINCPQHQEVIVYDNSPITSFDISTPTVALFTSPMAVVTYFKKYPHRYHPNIPIGLTTAAAITKSGKPIALIPTIPTEKGLADAVISYLKN